MGLFSVGCRCAAAGAQFVWALLQQCCCHDPFQSLTHVHFVPCPRWARRAKLAEVLTEKLPGVVAATIEVYNTIRAELLPTPAKSHYLYNMRDLSKLFQVCTKP